MWLLISSLYPRQSKLAQLTGLARLTRLGAVLIVGLAIGLAIGLAGCATTEVAVEPPVIQQRQRQDFQLAYEQVYLLGGYGAGLGEFSPGHGVVWQVDRIAGDGSHNAAASFIAERGLLERNDDGSSWWFLSYRNDDLLEHPLEYEFRINGRHRVLEARFTDAYTGERYAVKLQAAEGLPPGRADSGSALETPAGSLVETPEEPADGAAAEMGRIVPLWLDTIFYENIQRTWGGSLRQISRRRTRIAVPYGRFDTELIVYQLRGRRPEHQRTYHWWVNQQVPGELVQYEWLESDGSILRGQLLDISNGYRLRF